MSIDAPPPDASGHSEQPPGHSDEFQEYLELTSDWLWKTDAEHRFISIQVGRKLAGLFDPAPHLGKTRREIPWEDLPPGFWDAHQRILDAREPFSFVQPRRAPDGGLHHFEVVGRPRFDARGNFSGYIGFGRDVTASVEAEKRLVESEQRFRDLTNLGSDWYWEQDSEFRFTRMEGANLGKSGVDVATEVIGKRRWDLPILGMPEDDWARHKALLERHEAFENFEYRYRDRTGGVRWAAVSGKPVFDASGRFAGYRGTARDISAIKAAQAELRESEQRYRDIAELASDWFWEQDANFRFVRFSDALLRTTRFAVAAAEGKTRWELDILGVSAAQWAEHRAMLARHEPFGDFTYQVRTPAGELRWFRVSGKPLFTETGEFTGYRGAGKDVTDLVHAEQALRDSEHRIRMIAESVPANLAYYDRERRCRFTNRSYRGLFGFGEDILGKRVDEFFPPEIQRVVQPYWDAAFNGEPQHFERDHRRPDNSRVRLEIWLVPDIDENGEPNGVYTMLTDVTERAQAEAEIRRLNAGLEERVRQRTAELTASNKELEAFSYSISHDLRAPLRGIEGFAHILAEDYAERLDEDGRAHLARIRSATHRMAELIDDLIELGRVARLELRVAEIDLTRLAEEALVEIREKHPAPRLEAAVEENLVARADPRLIRILIENLLSNAAKFSADAPAPRIEFGRHAMAPKPAFFVRDNGIGFDMAHAGKLFQPFQRLHAPASYPGTGIGLATVLRIAQRHGGTAWAESQPGQGATFYFTLADR